MPYIQPGRGEFQDVKDSDGTPLYQRIAQVCQTWSSKSNVGLVAGATYPTELKLIREICPTLPFLIPGVGSQAGDLEEAVLAGINVKGRGAIINSSRGVIYASSGPDYAKAARKNAEELRNDINGVLEREGKGWS